MQDGTGLRREVGAQINTQRAAEGRGRELVCEATARGGWMTALGISAPAHRRRSPVSGVRLQGVACGWGVLCPQRYAVGCRGRTG